MVALETTRKVGLSPNCLSGSSPSDSSSTSLSSWLLSSSDNTRRLPSFLCALEEDADLVAAALDDDDEPDAFGRGLPVLVSLLLLCSCRVFEELVDDEVAFLEVESLSRLLSLEPFDDFLVVDVVDTVLIAFLLPLLPRLMPFVYESVFLDSFPYSHTEVRNTTGEIVLE